MIINQNEHLDFKNEMETVVIPHLKEEKITIEWLKHLLPIDQNYPQQALVQEGTRPVIKIKDSWVTIELLPIKREQATVQEDVKEAFGVLGKNIKNNCQIIFSHLEIAGLDKQDLIQLAVQSILEGAYTFNKKSLTQVTAQNIFNMREDLTDEKETIQITLVLEEKYETAIEKGIVYGKAINRARTVSNLPSNYLRVSDFAAYATALAGFYQLDINILKNKELEKLHSGGILSVNAANDEEANLIVLSYKGNPDSKELNAIIGKGVMFDAGGIHLKSSGGMDGMKYDMCGASNALAIIEIAAALKLKTNMIAVIPAVENLLNNKATKMGDVITTMSGKTVEVYNTDAEGRLILCDAITYAIKEGATQLIDIATLTYSCQGALGTDISGVFSNNQGFYETFAKHTSKMGEKIWRLPLDPIYHKVIRNTKTADLLNYGPGYDAGASTAACFLESFIEKDMPWIHLDVVGTSVCRSGKQHKEQGATGVLISSIASLIEG